MLFYFTYKQGRENDPSLDGVYVPSGKKLVLRMYIPKGKIRYLSLNIPRGHRGRLEFRLKLGNNAILPTSGYFTIEGITSILQVDYDSKGEYAFLEVLNKGRYEHFLGIGLFVETTEATRPYTEVVEVKDINVIGGDLPDYSSTVSKVAIETLSENQKGYWKSTEIVLEPNQEITFTIGKGFDDDLEYVPKGQIFFLQKVEASTEFSNYAITLGVSKQYYGSTTATALGFVSGFGRVVIEPSRAYLFEENTRPVYTLKNGSSSTVTVYVNVFGVVEYV